MSTRVPVINPEGELGTVDASEIEAALSSGYKKASPEEIRIGQARAEAADQPVLAGTEAALSTATFGLSREAANKLGITTPEAQRFRAEENPLASGVIGPAVGIAGSLLVGPEAGALKALGAAGEAAVGGAATARVASSLGKYLPVNVASQVGKVVSEKVAPSLAKGVSIIANPETRPIANAILKNAGPLAVGSAVETSLYGIGQTIDEHALGDTEAIGEKLVANIGFAAVFGGALGATLGAGKGAFESIAKVVKDSRAGKLEQLIDGAQAGQGGGEGAIIDKSKLGAAPVAGKEKIGVTPTSIEELKTRAEKFKQEGGTLDLPQKDVLQDAISRIEMENPVHPLQLDSLSSQAARDEYGMFKEMPGEVGDAIRNNEWIQKQELIKKINQEIGSLAPNHAPISDAYKGGEQASDIFTKNYEAEQRQLGPMFEKLKKIKVKDPTVAMGDAFAKITDRVPELVNAFEVKDGELIIKKYNTGMGIDKATYNATKELLDALKKNPTDFKTLQNIRNGLDQNIDVLAQGKAPSEIRAMKAAMMDYMIDVADRHPDIDVRDTIRRYAINEQERNVIEKTFGASVGKQELGIKSKVNPEDIGDKIFRNSSAVKAAKQILSPEDFNKILSNHIAEAIEKATDKGAFSSNKFNSWMNRNRDALNIAFQDNPAKLQRLQDMTTIMRILPDAPPVNPSGTAKTLVHALKNINSIADIPFSIVGWAKEKTLGAIAHDIELKNLNERLAGRPGDKVFLDYFLKTGDFEGAQKAAALSKIEKMTQKTTDTIVKGVRNLVSPGKQIIAIEGIKAHEIKPEERSKLVAMVERYNADPEAFVNEMSKQTEDLYSVAPNIAQSAQVALAKSNALMMSVIPHAPPSSPLSKPYQPSRAEIAKFERTYSAISNPLGIINQAIKGTLTPEAVNAVETVYPKLMEEIKMRALEEMNKRGDKIHSLPMKHKIGLSALIGADLVNSLRQENLFSNQMSLATPGLQQAQNQMGVAAKVSASGASKITLANRSATETSRTENRKLV